MENPWNIQSIYELQYFKCPSCEVMKHYSKQELIDHAFEYHPESVLFLSKINDNSLSDVSCPWSRLVTEIKLEEPNFNENFEESVISKSATDPFENLEEFKKETIITENYVMSNLQNGFTEEINTSDIETASKTNSLNINVHGLVKSIKKYVCEVCNKEFNLKRQLKCHIKTFHEKYEKIIICDMCGKTFSNKDSLKKHRRHIHEGVKDYICNYCSKAFRESHDMKHHIKSVHEGIRDHICDLCGEKFGKGSSLTRHKKTVHENSRDHVCQFCNKAFVESSRLKQHITIVHEGIKKWKCDICERKFGQRSKMNVHIRNAHPESIKLL